MRAVRQDDRQGQRFRVRQRTLRECHSDGRFHKRPQAGEYGELCSGEAIVCPDPEENGCLTKLDRPTTDGAIEDLFEGFRAHLDTNAVMFRQGNGDKKSAIGNQRVLQCLWSWSVGAKTTSEGAKSKLDWKIILEGIQGSRLYCLRIHYRLINLHKFKGMPNTKFQR